MTRARRDPGRPDRKADKRETTRHPVEIARRRRRWMRVRIAALGVLLLVGAGTVLRRAYDLQVERAPELREMAEAQYLRNIKLAPKRGTIYDRHGAELAVSVEVDSVWANPRELRGNGGDPASVAARLSRVLNIDVERITTRLSSDRYFVWIERHVTPAQAQAVRDLGIQGVHLEGEARRFYPNRELASHILGFANVDGEGIEGLELSFEQHLRGSVRAVPAIRDRRGAVVFSEQLLDDRAAQGDDVHLTIDRTIQRIAEHELELTVRTFEAQAGSVVVMDPRTGELLAIANYPSFNPNEPGRAPPSSRRNRALTDRYEPGSTMKPFTIAGAFAAGTIRADEIIDCGGGELVIGEYTIHDSHRYDSLTPAQVLAFSSNIGTANIGFTLGRRGMFRALRRFGFGQAAGLPLPGETSGTLMDYRRWSPMDQATISFGQGMSVTTLQMASAMSVLANGGRLMEPLLVRKVTDSEGEIVDEHAPTVRRQVIPRATARLVADMMTAVTGPGGTGAQAAIDGYLVAGKTGTAQKADYVHGGYADGRWLASFVGFVPVDEPRLVIAVAIDEPMIAYYGGVVAAPVFRRVGEAALRHLGVSRPDGGQALVRHQREQRRARREEEAAAREARRSGRGADTDEDDDELVEYVPARDPEAGEALVPDLGGMSARQALVALRGAGLLPTLQGSGVVVSQNPPAASIVPAGARVRFVLDRPSAEVDDIDVDPAVHGGDAPASPVPAGAEPGPLALAGPERSEEAP